MTENSVCCLPPPLSGAIVGSFAYKTIKDRLPIILTKVIDEICRARSNASEQNCDKEAFATVAGILSKLKYEMQTDKPITEIEDTMHDCTLWNELISAESSRLASVSDGLKNQTCSWFCSPWLFVECYLYRRINSAFLNAASAFQLSCIGSFDPFAPSKQLSLTSSMHNISSLLDAYENNLRICESTDQLKHLCQQLVEICLWGNQCDLSLSAGERNIGVSDDAINTKRFCFKNCFSWEKHSMVCQ